jgi:predicted MFS family arabinose efflux permease
VATGVGLAIGPVLGSFIFEFFGYRNTFILYGGILLIAIIPLLIFVPKKPNRLGYNRSRQESLENSLKLKASNAMINGKPISYSMFLFNLRCVVNLFACTVLLLLINFLDSILAVWL